MNVQRQELLGHLEAYYRGCGWPVRRDADGTVRAEGPGSVTWIGLAVVPDDLGDETFSKRLLDLADVRMRTGERCPLELLPAAECEDELRRLLAQLRLIDRVPVYALAPAA